MKCVQLCTREKEIILQPFENVVVPHIFRLREKEYLPSTREEKRGKGNAKLISLAGSSGNSI